MNKFFLVVITFTMPLSAMEKDRSLSAADKQELLSVIGREPQELKDLNDNPTHSDEESQIEPRENYSTWMKRQKICAHNLKIMCSWIWCWPCLSKPWCCPKKNSPLK